MGKRGPAPAPTNVKRLHGTRPSRINDAEPVPPEAEVGPPAWLSAAAREVWAELAPGLIAHGVLTSWDVHGLAVYCDACVRYARAAADVAERGMLVTSRKAKVKNPSLQLCRDAAADMARFGARYGLTPADRSQIRVERPEPGSDLLSDPRRLLS